MSEAAPADAVCCTVCGTAECDRHSLHQQAATRMVSVGMMRGMDGTMTVVEVEEVKPRRLPGRLTICG